MLKTRIFFFCNDFERESLGPDRKLLKLNVVRTQVLQNCGIEFQISVHSSLMELNIQCGM
jgi:hypothetical protein